MTKDTELQFKNLPIIFTRTKALRFLEIYTESVNHGNEVFNFEGHEFLTAYAKYLIEYLIDEGWLGKNSLNPHSKEK